MNDIILPAKNIIMSTKTTDEDKIVMYLQGKLKRTELSKKMEEKLNRYNHCADLIKKYGSRLKVVPMMVKKFNLPETSYSEPQAYKDFNATQQIFGTTQQHNQQFWVDILLGQIMQNMKKARKAGDYKSVAAFTREMRTTIKELMGTADVIPYEKLVPPVPVVGFFPDSLNVNVPSDLDYQIELLKKSKISRVVQDIDYEKVD
ncbi:MAG: hypothetical protein JXR07_20550 [Reichenbachiella sp.]